jgi:hypothetical protein
MASSYVHPIARLHTPRANFRPKLAIASRANARRTDDAVTDNRSTGVGMPTIDPPADVPLPTAALVQEAVATALDSLGALEHQARDVARRFRRPPVAEAQFGLTQLVQSMQTLLRLAEMTATASGTDLESLCEAEGLTAPAETNAAVSSLIREQMAGDWRAVAGVLERPFLSALGAWRRVFEVLGPDPGPYGTAA